MADDDVSNGSGKNRIALEEYRYSLGAPVEAGREKWRFGRLQSPYKMVVQPG